jgi:hypothetical protein
MFSMAVAGPVTMSQETGPEQLPASPRLALAEPPAPTQRGGLRPLAVAQCSLCGIALPLGLLIPDGGQACADVHWYCKDAKSCTERWTTAPPRLPPGVDLVGGSPASAQVAATGVAAASVAAASVAAAVRP